MSAFLTLDRLSAATPDGTPLFFDLTLSLSAECVGLVGRNGSGKSTLLSIINGARAPSGGTVQRAGRFAVLAQVQDETQTLAEALGTAEALARLRRLESGEGAPDDADLADWTLESRIAEALAQVRLPVADLARRVATLSGGERTRLALAAMLIGEPDVLLLDEPTNNLDADGRAAISELLAGWRGGVLVASHDRDLLEHADRIVELSPTGCTVFGGGWSAFAAARDAMRERVQTELAQAERAVKQTVRAVQAQAERQARRDKGGRADATKGGAPKILLGAQKRRAEATAGRGNLLAERLTGAAADELAQARQRVDIVTPLHIDLPRTNLPANRTLLRFEEVVLERGDRRLFGPLNFDVTGPERLVVRGPNGSGKSSLLHLAMGDLLPTRGRVSRAEGALVLLDQHGALLDPALDLVANMQARHPGMTQGAAHDLLARFAFCNRDARRPVASLSGGERLRAGLAMLTGGSMPPQMLLLDEPTNHLDIAAIELLERALAGFDGALMTVSHDPRFVDAVGCEREIVLSVAPG